MNAWNAPSTFIVRISRDDAGDVACVVEQVRTGRKERVQSVADVSRVIAAMVAGGTHRGGSEEP